MGIEIERKFLVSGDSWRASAIDEVVMKQGYFDTAPGATVRVRIAGMGAFLTIKGAARSGGFAHSEFEYPIPVSDAEALLAQFCAGRTVEKSRFHVPFDGAVFEVDVFSGRHAGLTVAELELASESSPVPAAPWLGKDVTGDFHYSNHYMARH